MSMSLQTTAQRYPVARPFNAITDRQTAKALQNRLNEPTNLPLRHAGDLPAREDRLVPWLRRPRYPPQRVDVVTCKVCPREIECNRKDCGAEKGEGCWDLVRNLPYPDGIYHLTRLMDAGF